MENAALDAVGPGTTIAHCQWLNFIPASRGPASAKTGSIPFTDPKARQLPVALACDSRHAAEGVVQGEELGPFVTTHARP